ncbi:lysine-sensitive aspartokinase 3 [Idiomarina xiamenensis]|uniref:Aspartokinase n=1 Tax=Idiomarina xiamenensis 10-D-4 TaxID=740709 RepID=K2JJW4_9GAMM|nr:lysine-sensitive aspartokinase 3 [Idiomarina xiamenensis]EKE83706.1 aspartate kinase III [Idiomarina xiamenensis 10-D-4]
MASTRAQLHTQTAADHSSAAHYVLKFGGSSLADPVAMQRCIVIIQQTPAARWVVVSAPAGVTNALLAIADSGKDGAVDEQLLLRQREQIQQRLTAFADWLKLEPTQPDWQSIQQQLSSATACQGASRDQLLSLGERCSALLLTLALQQQGIAAQHVPAQHWLRTDSCYGDAEADPQASRQQLAALDVSHGIQITEGFTGADQHGNTTTLGRGGSDYSAALLAEASAARQLQIWTDVAGLYSCDPRLVPEAHPIAELAFAEAAELATFGANVLHPKTLWPAMRADIPVFIGSTLNIEQDKLSRGTLIRRQVSQQSEFTALALRRRQTLLKISSPDMLYRYGFLAKVFAILADQQVSVDLVTTSEISVALTLDERGSRQALSTQALQALQQLGQVSVEHDLALVAVVGSNLSQAPQLAARLFTALAGINVRLINHGASRHNLCLLVAEADAEASVRQLHQALLSKNATR